MKAAPCTIDSMVWVPRAWMSALDKESMRAELILYPKDFQTGNLLEPIQLYRYDKATKRYGLPIRTGIDWLRVRGKIPHSEYVTSYGHPIKARKFPKPRPGQKKFMRRMLATLRKRKTALAKAATGCISGDAVIHINRAGKGTAMRLDLAYKKWNGIKDGAHGPKWDTSIPTFCRSLVDGELRQHRVTGIVCSGVRDTVIVTFKSGKKLRCTPNHLIAMPGGEWMRADDLLRGHIVLGNGRFLDDDGYVILTGERWKNHPRANNRTGSWEIREHIVVAEKKIGRRIRRYEEVHHKNGKKDDNRPSNLVVKYRRVHRILHADHKHLHGSTGKHGQLLFVPCQETVVSVKPAGRVMTYDVQMESPHNNFVANGIVVHNSGKTVVALRTAGKLGRTTLVIVPSKQLANQWTKEIQEHLGIPLRKIGRVEEGKAVWKNKSIVVAVIHNLVQKDWSPDFYEYFGFVIWDEAHRLGSRSFAESISMFPAKYKLALTATPHRKDGCADIFLFYFGKPSIVSKTPAMACDCFVIDYHKKGAGYSYGVPHGILLNLLASDKSRNVLILRKIMRLYERGRQILVIGDRIDQLQRLQHQCIRAGVPEENAGLFTRQYIGENGKRKKAKQADLDEVLANARIIFATYSMMKEGIDVPRLDAGVEATPRSEGVQVIGRIRRPLPDKLRPRWLTIRDHSSPKLLRSTASRIRDYHGSNVTVHNE